MIEVANKLPEAGEWITAEINYAGSTETVKGRAMDNPEYVVFDFYSGVAGEKILRWEPRVPSFEEGHPYTAIERGMPR